MTCIPASRREVTMFYNINHILCVQEEEMRSDEKKEQRRDDRG